MFWAIALVGEMVFHLAGEVLILSDAGNSIAMTHPSEVYFTRQVVWLLDSIEFEPTVAPGHPQCIRLARCKPGQVGFTLPISTE